MKDEVVSISQSVYTDVYTSYNLKGEINIESLNNANVRLSVAFFDNDNNLLVTDSVYRTSTTNGYISMQLHGSKPLNTVQASVYVAIQGDSDNATGDITVDSLSYIEGISSMNTSLAVISANPENGSVDVPVNTKVQIAFNRDVKQGSHYDNIVMKNGDDPVSVTKSIYSNKLVITPSANLSHGVTYSVYLPIDALIDNLGFGLNDPFLLNFTTINLE
jgi:hypothetical protein